MSLYDVRMISLVTYWTYYTTMLHTLAHCCMFLYPLPCYIIITQWAHNCRNIFSVFFPSGGFFLAFLVSCSDLCLETSSGPCLISDSGFCLVSYLYFCLEL